MLDVHYCLPAYDRRVRTDVFGEGTAGACGELWMSVREVGRKPAEVATGR